MGDSQWLAPHLMSCTDTTDTTERPTRAVKVYRAAVLDVFTRQDVGWLIADHMCSKLIVGVRADKFDASGCVTLRINGRLHHTRGRPNHA